MLPRKLLISHPRISTTLNMNVITPPPRKISSHQFLSLGAVGWVYKINDRIALKYPRQPGCANFAHEIKIFDILERHSPPPDIVQSFLRVPEGIFLAYLSGGTLDQRLRAHQILDGHDYWGRVVQVSKQEPTPLVEQWIMELSNAAAWLESLGYAHTDIRPPNLLLDSQDHLKLSDFDNMIEIGTRADGATAPWARILGPEAGSEKGTFGRNGARLEQFAIGSILYCMTRGFEPYEDEEFSYADPTLVVDRLQDMVFPDLDGGHLDRIIDRCWKGEFGQLKDLAAETKLLGGAVDLPRVVFFETVYYLKCQ